MLDKIKNYPKEELLDEIRDPRIIGLLVFLIIVLLISWSGVKVIQSNYLLQKRIATLQQELAIQELQTNNQKLQNTYLNSNQYLDIAARQNFGLASPGEKVLVVPKAVAMKYAPAIPDFPRAAEAEEQRPAIVRNLMAWRDFFFK